MNMQNMKNPLGFTSKTRSRASFPISNILEKITLFPSRFTIKKFFFHDDHVPPPNLFSGTKMADLQVWKFQNCGFVLLII
jgi:hypothetical protein